MPLHCRLLSIHINTHVIILYKTVHVLKCLIIWYRRNVNMYNILCVGCLAANYIHNASYLYNLYHYMFLKKVMSIVCEGTGVPLLYKCQLNCQTSILAMHKSRFPLPKILMMSQVTWYQNNKATAYVPQKKCLHV